MGIEFTFSRNLSFSSSSSFFPSSLPFFSLNFFCLTFKVGVTLGDILQSIYCTSPDKKGTVIRHLNLRLSVIECIKGDFGLVVEGRTVS